jgi:hypothetical protein
VLIMHSAMFIDPASAVRFIQAGSSTVTLVSKATGARFTYKVQAPHHEGNQGTNSRRDTDSDFRFVSLLNGQDNEASYAYIGYIRRGVFFHGGAKARAGRDAPSVKAFDWVWRQLAQGNMPGQAEIWHEGRCGACGRKLTVPSSINTGFGPECADRLGIVCEETTWAA